MKVHVIWNCISCLTKIPMCPENDTYKIADSGPLIGGMPRTTWKDTDTIRGVRNALDLNLGGKLGRDVYFVIKLYNGHI